MQRILVLATMVMDTSSAAKRVMDVMGGDREIGGSSLLQARAREIPTEKKIAVMVSK